jgi:hypothetical protein
MGPILRHVPETNPLSHFPGRISASWLDVKSQGWLLPRSAFALGSVRSWFVARARRSVRFAGPVRFALSAWGTCLKGGGC